MNKIVIAAFVIAFFNACTDSKSKNDSGFEIKGNLSNSKSESIFSKVGKPVAITSVSTVLCLKMLGITLEKKRVILLLFLEF